MGHLLKKIYAQEIVYRLGQVVFGQVSVSIELSNSIFYHFVPKLQAAMCLRFN